MEDCNVGHPKFHMSPISSPFPHQSPSFHSRLHSSWPSKVSLVGKWNVDSRFPERKKPTWEWRGGDYEAKSPWMIQNKNNNIKQKTLRKINRKSENDLVFSKKLSKPIWDTKIKLVTFHWILVRECWDPDVMAYFQPCIDGSIFFPYKISTTRNFSLLISNIVYDRILSAFGTQTTHPLKKKLVLAARKKKQTQKQIHSPKNSKSHLMSHHLLQHVFSFKEAFSNDAFHRSPPFLTSSYSDIILLGIDISQDSEGSPTSSNDHHLATVRDPSEKGGPGAGLFPVLLTDSLKN